VVSTQIIDRRKTDEFSGVAKFGFSMESEIDAESLAGSTRLSTSSGLSDFSDFDECVDLLKAFEIPGLTVSSESPYPEVRASVSSIDDPSMPVNTFRMWFLGLLYTVLISGMNQLFGLRCTFSVYFHTPSPNHFHIDPSIIITGITAQLTSLPLGKALEKILPKSRFRTFGYVWSLNPGPFNIKEHVVITVMANVVVGGAYATDIVLTQKIFYGQQVPFSYQIMIALSSQIIGFSLGGIMRRFLVWPASMIWPGALVNCALFNTLHRNYSETDRRHISREKFFCLTLACSFVWYWVPGYLFTALSVFNWVCWIVPNNVIVNQLLGTQSGLGMSIFTFDWAMISYIGSPLVTPVCS
jgi:OPT family oligopeptide transporter